MYSLLLLLSIPVSQYRGQDKELEGGGWLSVQQSVVWPCHVQPVVGLTDWTLDWSVVSQSVRNIIASKISNVFPQGDVSTVQSAWA